ncbi:MAG: L-threonine 3-dehydrogenase [Planctomycetes bacterium]|nr:L-threonine 3-dehydrogenase [Planctomycetota bacterium]
MKAIVKKYPEPGLWMDSVPIPPAGTNEVLIKIQKTAICGTDLHIQSWDEWAQRAIKTPLVIGHEFMGEVAAVGPGVAGFAAGDRVTGEGHLTCGTCRNCRAGKRHLCHRTIGIGVQRDGAFAEYLVMPESNLMPVHPEIPSEIAAFFDPLGNATHCALSFDMVGEDVLITGAGPIGIMAAAICRFVGARHIVVTDLNDYRLALARKMGASRAINVTRASIEDAIKDLRMSNGFDIGLEMSGNSIAFRDMLRNMYHGGRVALLGILPGSTQINWDEVIFKGLVLKGIYGREMFETWYKMTQMLRSGLNVAPVLTHRFPCEEFQTAFEILKSGESGKVILEWD